MRRLLYVMAAGLMLSGTALAAGGAGGGGAGGAGGGAAGGAAGGAGGTGSGAGAAASADTKTIGDPSAYTPSTDPSGSAVTPNTARESPQSPGSAASTVR